MSFFIGKYLTFYCIATKKCSYLLRPMSKREYSHYNPMKYFVTFTQVTRLLIRQVIIVDVVLQSRCQNVFTFSGALWHYATL